MQAIYNIKVLLIVFVMAHFSYAGFSCQDMLSSLSQWKKPRDTLQFIDIPRTHEEQELKRRGHSKQFYAGVDEMNYLIQLGNHLREHSIDPQRTHIENFVPLIAHHFQHLREGWQYYGPTLQGPPLGRLRLRFSKTKADLNYRILRNPFASYLASAVFLFLTQRIRETNQPLTLEVWQNLNLWWAILMIPLRYLESDPERVADYFRTELKNQQKDYWPMRLFQKKGSKQETDETSKEGIFNQYSSYDFSIPFPEKVILPTISPLGVSAINRVAGGDQVIPVELSHRVSRQDRVLMHPLDLFQADLHHVSSANYGQPLFNNPLFHHQLMSYFEELPLKKREQAEIIYLILIHELPNLTEDFPSIESITDQSSLLKILLSSFIARPIVQNMIPANIKTDLPDDSRDSRDSRYFVELIEADINRMKKGDNYGEQKYMDSLSPEIRDFLNQTDVVVETIDNPQLLEESAEVFIQAVQHVLQNHPETIRN